MENSKTQFAAADLQKFGRHAAVPLLPSLSRFGHERRQEIHCGSTDKQYHAQTKTLLIKIKKGQNQAWRLSPSQRKWYIPKVHYEGHCVQEDTAIIRSIRETPTAPTARALIVVSDEINLRCCESPSLAVDVFNWLVDSHLDVAQFVGCWTPYIHF